MTALEELTASLLPGEFHPSVYELEADEPFEVSNVEAWNPIRKDWFIIRKIVRSYGSYNLYYGRRSYWTQRQNRGDQPIRLREIK